MMRARIRGLALVAALAWAAGARAQPVVAGRVVTDPTAGRVVADTVHSVALERNVFGDSPDRSLLVYLPPSYAQGTRRYPVLYLLHGFGATETSWVRGYSGFNIGTVMDSLIAAGSAREFIIVMPNAKNKVNGSFYTNSASAGDWDDFVARDLVQHIDRKYRTLARPESRGLAGHSMGGFGTFAVGMRHAGDVYSALYSLSGCCTRFSTDAPRGPTWTRLVALTSLDSVPRLTFIQQVNLAFAAAFSPNPSKRPLFVDLPVTLKDTAMVPVAGVLDRWVANAPYDMIPRYREKLLRLRDFAFDVGLSDNLVPSATLAAMDSAFTRAGVKHTYETYDGDHTNRVGLRMITRVLPFFSRTLDFGPQ
jgi:enterochelin esterase-like enzyme